MDNANTRSYSGFDLVNLRTGYTVGRCEVWVNALNLFNKYYSTFASKSSYGYSYNLGDPREWNVGMAFRMGKK